MNGLHLVTGEKGGVGKSLWSMALLEYLRLHSIEHQFFDADRTSPDVGAIYFPEIYKGESNGYQPDNQKGARKLYFSEDEEDIFLADSLFDTACSQLTLVNLPAQVQIVVDRWLQERGILSLAASEKLPMTFWFVTDGSPESLELLERSLLIYGEDINHAVVLNQGLSKRVVETVAGHPIFEKISQRAIAMLTMPELSLSSPEKNHLKEKRIILSEAAERTSNSGLTLIAKQRIKNFLTHCHQEIAKTSLFPTTVTAS